MSPKSIGINSRSLTFLAGIAVFGILVASSGWADDGKKDCLRK